MKIFSTTFDDRERTLEIISLVGRTFPFLKKLKMGGSGSRRMMVSEVSEEFREMVNPLTNVNYGSLEIRPHGIIFHLVQAGLKSWSWVIPYSELDISLQNGLKVAAGGAYIFVKEQNLDLSHKKFVQKIIQLQQKNQAVS